MTQASQDVKDVVWDYTPPSPTDSPPRRSRSQPVSRFAGDLSALRALFPPSSTKSASEEKQQTSFLSVWLSTGEPERKRRLSDSSSSNSSPDGSLQQSPTKAVSTKKYPRNNVAPSRPHTRSISKSLAATSTPPKSPKLDDLAPTKSPPSTPDKPKQKKTDTTKTPTKTPSKSLQVPTKTPTKTPTKGSKRTAIATHTAADEIDLTSEVTVCDVSSTPRVKGLVSLALQKTPKKAKLTQPTPITQVSQATYHSAVRFNKQPSEHITSPKKSSPKAIPPSPASPKHKPVPLLHTTTTTAPTFPKPTPVTPSQSRSSEVVIAKTEMIKKQFERFMVMEVSFSRFQGASHVWGAQNVSKPTNQRIMVLRLFNELTLSEKYVTLEGDWCETPAKPGHVVHVLATFDPETRHAVINDDVGIIVLHPDLLISGTSVSSSFSCMRRAVLNERIRDGGTNSAATYGSLIHGVLQKALTSKQFSPKYLEEAIENSLKKGVVDLAVVGESDEGAREKLLNYIPSIAAWGSVFVTDKLGASNCIDIGRDTASVCITKVLEVEESVWSPMYGLKGKIDATVEVKTTHSTWNNNKSLTNNNKNSSTTKTDNPTLTVPMEIKTGSDFDSAAHRAQLLLYSLLLSDRYAMEVKSGLLFYIRSADKDPKFLRTSSDTSMRTSNDMRTSAEKPPVRATSDLPLRTSNNQTNGNNNSDNGFYGSMKGVETRHNEIRGILISRNVMANYLYEYSMNPEQSELPSVIRNPFTCKHCYISESCMLYHKAYENGTPATSGVEELFSKHTSHISTEHLQFFKTWDQCISWEASLSLNLQKDIWAFSSKDRESQGKCFANMVMVEEHPSSKGYEYVFGKLTDGKVTASPAFINLLDQHINTGDYICVSTEEGEFGLGAGIVKKLSLDSVVISCSDRISQPLAAKRGDMVRIFTEDSHLPAVLWRLDRNEVGSGFSTARANLLKLFNSNDTLTVKRRRLIVDLESPLFETPLSQSRPTTTTKSGSSPSRSPYRHRWASHSDFAKLNTDQLKAIQTVLSANDYALILGMPGTGKTTTIALMVKAVAMEGKSILITSYTHSAVDNLLLKLAELKIDFLRLGGSSEQIQPDLRKYTLDYQSFPSIAKLEAFLETKNIVATTCLGINSPLITRRTFDYCIVDEASQITLPVCLGPLRFASVFVLVGDHYQLPPLVRSPEAKAKGLDQSLFKRLGEAHPEAVSSLLYQYRMNADIMLISNTLIYSHQLRCGTSGVAESMLSLNMGIPSSWIDEVVLPSRKVIFLNTDAVPALESRYGDVIKNDVEALLVAQIADVLLQYGLAPSNLGIISPYRSQLKVIRQLLGEYASQSSSTSSTQLSPGGLSQSYPHSKIEAHTVDKFQGRDKDCIIVSLVRANESQMVGDLLKDWRRVNVAFTRAKKKLIVLGSLSTLQSTHLFKMFLDLLKSQKWIYNLPHAAHTNYKRVVPTTPTHTGGSKPREKKIFSLKTARRSILKNILDAT